MSSLDWTALPTELLQELSSHLDDVAYVRFRSVCTSWRSAAPKRPQIPWLAVDYHDDINNNGFGLCNFPDAMPNHYPLLAERLARGEVIVGSSYGWIAFINDAPCVFLHNPFTEASSCLPPFTALPWMNEHEDWIYAVVSGAANKVVLSSDPRNDDCIIMALSHHQFDVIYCRPNDASWTSMPMEGSRIFSDVIFYRRKIYAVEDYEVYVCDPWNNDAELTKIPTVFSDGIIRHGVFDVVNEMGRYQQSFLVVSSGDLLLVSITVPHNLICEDRCGGCCEEFRVEVFRVDEEIDRESNMTTRLVKLENLDGRALFLSKKSASVSVSPGDSSRCKANCIYITLHFDGYMYGDGNHLHLHNKEIILVCDMEDGSISPNVVSSARGSHWLTPSLT